MQQGRIPVDLQITLLTAWWQLEMTMKRFPDTLALYLPAYTLVRYLLRTLVHHGQGVLVQHPLQPPIALSDHEVGPRERRANQDIGDVLCTQTRQTYTQCIA